MSCLSFSLDFFFHQLAKHSNNYNFVLMYNPHVKRSFQTSIATILLSKHFTYFHYCRNNQARYLVNYNFSIEGKVGTSTSAIFTKAVTGYFLNFNSTKISDITDDSTCMVCCSITDFCHFSFVRNGFCFVGNFIPISSTSTVSVTGNIKKGLSTET